MDYLVFARWFGIVSVILSFGILFNLEDAKDMAKQMVNTDTGYIMGGVLPVVFGSLSLLFINPIDFNWSLVVTLVGATTLSVGIYRVFFPKQWKNLMAQHLEQLPFLFSLFGLMLGVVLLFVGFLAGKF